MENTYNKMCLKNLFVLSFVFIVLASFVGAYGVATPHWDDYPFIVPPGESGIITLTLQNMVGSEDVFFEGKIVKGGEIARIIDDSTVYSVPIGVKDVPVKIEVTVSDLTELGTLEEIRVEFRQVSLAEEAGMLQVTGSFTTAFPVLAGELPELAPEEGNKTMFIVFGIIILIILIIFWIRRKNK